MFFYGGQKKISIRVTNYNRRHDCGHHLFKRAPVPIYLFLSFIKSQINGQSLKALNPSLFCEYFDNRKVEFWKFWSALVLARCRMPWWLQAKCTGSDPYVTTVTALIRINFSSNITFTITHFYTFLWAGDVLSLTVLAPAQGKYHVSSVSPNGLVQSPSRTEGNQWNLKGRMEFKRDLRETEVWEVPQKPCGSPGEPTEQNVMGN